VCLGQLSPDTNLSIAQNSDHILQRSLDSVRGFEEHQDPPLLSEAMKPPLSVC
jgi:hypothetical protein